MTIAGTNVRLTSRMNATPSARKGPNSRVPGTMASTNVSSASTTVVALDATAGPTLSRVDRMAANRSGCAPISSRKRISMNSA
jgi:hypothetical protein